MSALAPMGALATIRTQEFLALNAGKPYPSRNFMPEIRLAIFPGRNFMPEIQLTISLGRNFMPEIRLAISPGRDFMPEIQGKVSRGRDRFKMLFPHSEKVASEERTKTKNITGQ